MGCSYQGAEITPTEPAQDNACEGKEVNFFNARQPHSRIYLTLKINTMILFRVNNFIRIVTLIILFPVLLSAQEKISGIIKDKNSGEPIVNAVVHIDSTFLYSLTNQNGEFKFSGLKGNSFPLSITHIAYLTEKKLVSNSREILIEMLPKLYLSEEVNISATRVDNRSSVAFSELNKSDIEKHNLGQDLPFLLNMTPSVVVTSDGGTGIGYTGIRIRGSDATRVNVTINGIPVNDAESHQVYWVDLPDLASSVENIQIQRGLGSSTNGAGAFGGSINILSNKLSVEPFASASSSAGSFHTFKNTIMFGSGILSDAFAIEGRVSKINSGGYIDRAASDLSSFYLSGGYYGKNNSLRLIVLSGKEKTYQAWYGVPQDSLITNRTYNPAGEYYDNQGNTHYYDNQTDNYRQDYYQLLFSHEFSKSLFGNFALHYTRGKGYYEEYKPDEPLLNYNLPSGAIIDSTTTSMDIIRQLWLSNYFYGLTWSIGYEKNKIKIKAGGALNKYTGDHYGELISSAKMLLLQYPFRYYINSADKTDASAFIRTSFSANEKMNFYIDLQERIVSYSFEGFDDSYLNSQQNVRMNFFNPKAGLNYTASEKIQFYFSAGLGYKEPVRDDFTNSIPSKRPNAESMIDYETGARLNSGKSSFNINAFYMNYKSQLILTGKINDVGEYIRESVENSYRKGIEFSGEINFSSMINFRTNISLSDNKIKLYREFVYDYDSGEQILNEYKSTSISFSPDLTGSVILGIVPVKNLNIELTGKYVGKQYLDNTMNETRKLNSYFINDLHLSYTIHPGKIKEIRFQFSLNNFLNREYISNGYSYSGYINGKRNDYNYYFPQAKVNFMGGVVVRV